MNKYKKSEKKSASLVGGKRQAGSGAFFWAKGDIVHPLFLIEHKETEKQQMSLKLAWLEKIDRECRTSTKRPALMVYFSTAMMPYRRWVFFPKDDKKFGDIPITHSQRIDGVKSLILMVEYLRMVYQSTVRSGLRAPLFVLFTPQLSIQCWHCTTLEAFNEAYYVE